MGRSGSVRVLVVALVALVVLAGCDWDQFGNGPGNARASEDDGVTIDNVATLAHVWQGNGGDVHSTPAISKGLAYSGMSGAIFASDTTTACPGPAPCLRRWWSQVTDNTAATTTMNSPAVADGVVVITSVSGTVAAFDAAGQVGCHTPGNNCDPLWIATVTKPATSPTVFDGTVYLGTGAGVATFDLHGQTGCSGAPVVCSPRWTAPTPTAATMVAISDGLAFTSSDRVQAFDATGVTGCTGVPVVCSPQWTSAPIAGLGAPALSNHVLYVPAAPKVYAFPAVAGAQCAGALPVCTPIWTGTAPGAFSVAVAKGVVYAAGSKLAALDAAGQQGCAGTPRVCAALWTSSTRVVAPASPAVANGLVYAPTGDHALSVYDASGVRGCGGTPKVCRPVRTATLPGNVGASPVVAQGTVYLSNDGLQGWKPTPSTRPTCPTNPHVGLGPCQIQDAYRLPSATMGDDRVIAIVDAYHDPNVRADLNVYRAEYGLPVCSYSCFHIVDQRGNPNGGTAATNAGWAVETSLDLDMASATCPRCRLLLVEADDDSVASLTEAVRTAIAQAPAVVSNSFGGPEFPQQTTLDASFKGNGIPVLASTGDDGYGVSFPASSPNTIAVGGTELTADPGNSRGWVETAWAGAGSGCSVYERKPAWQTDTGCTKRTVADVSAIAGAPGLAVYDTFAGVPGWITVQGTSASAPIVAGAYALSATTGGAAQLWHSSSRFDVTSGSNGTCGGLYLCTAGSGFDGPTGVGTPCGTGALSVADVTTADCASITVGAGLRAFAAPAPRPVASTPTCPAVPAGRMRCFVRRVVPG
jgi:hypothetical protein